MSIDIEKELHNLLLGLSPCSGNEDIIEQSIIIAEASAIFNTMTRKASISSTNNKKWREAKMLDALLTSMQNHYAKNNEEKISAIDATDLTPEQIVHKASRLQTAPMPSDYDQPFGNNMDILNDNDLEPFLHNSTEGRTAEDYLIDDLSLLHPVNVFSPPGWGRHRSDSTRVR